MEVAAPLEAMMWPRWGKNEEGSEQGWGGRRGCWV